MFKHRANLLKAVCLCCLFAAIPGVGQTITPPIAEYRGKADGMFELRNDGDAPLAAIVEVQGFEVDQDGSLKYKPADKDLNVVMGSNSFIIPPHQTHMVFYKAVSKKPQAWFTILSTLTKAATNRQQMRINFVLPHVVYLYQKQKLKKEDVAVSVSPGSKPGEFQVELQNRSDKLARVGNLNWRGFEKNGESGGFPVFPNAKRIVRFQAGSPSSDANVKVSFEDGFSADVAVQQ
ncbi:MAG TPA: hypothetical protein VD837_09220 [Terriglobales bacterium]|nr:hypothetical protein [Terriglobales bacterium]